MSYLACYKHFEVQYQKGQEFHRKGKGNYSHLKALQPVSSKVGTENTDLFCSSPGLLPHGAFLTGLPVPSLKPKDTHLYQIVLTLRRTITPLSSDSLLMSSNWP